MYNAKPLQHMDPYPKEVGAMAQHKLANLWCTPEKLLQAPQTTFLNQQPKAVHQQCFPRIQRRVQANRGKMYIFLKAQQVFDCL